MESEQPIHGPEEVRLLKLLSEIRAILGKALDSLGGKSPATPEAHYLGLGAITVNHAAAGYLSLRELCMVHASKFQIRPAIEATFAGIAAIKNPDFLFRKAYSEWLEDKKLAAKSPTAQTALNDAFEEMKRNFKQRFPNRSMVLERVSVKETADLAGLSPVYEGAYRVYCQFTHGALRAATGHLDEATDASDTLTVTWCVLAMLDHLQKHTPAEIPDLSRFVESLDYKREL
jgi:hypothetical protein